MRSSGAGNFYLHTGQTVAKWRAIRYRGRIAQDRLKDRLQGLNDSIVLLEHC